VYKWVRAELDKDELHPLIIIALWAVIFLEIHPFQDGNGRLSRALTTLLLLKTGYAYVPYCSLESIIEQNKEGYYLALRQTQGAIRSEYPNWQPWVEFFFQSLTAQVKRLEKKIEYEKIILAPLPDLSIKMVELAREHGKISISDVVRLTGANRNALKVHFRKLVQLNHLEQHGQGRGVWYSLK
jgi:Fic family protein